MAWFTLREVVNLSQAISLVFDHREIPSEGSVARKRSKASAMPKEAQQIEVATAASQELANYIIPDNLGAGCIRTAGTWDAPMFCLSDVCRALGISQIPTVAARLKDDEKGIVLTNTLGGKQNMVFVTEKAFYKVVLRSDKPNAEAFADWVAGEVLPAIRKTGSFSLTPKQQKRPWSERINQTWFDHMTEIEKHHPGCWTVIFAMSI